MNGSTLGIILIAGAMALGLIFGELLPDEPIPVIGNGIVDDAEQTVAIQDPDALPECRGQAGRGN